MKINVVDSPMGSGKTTYAFNKMYEEADRKYIFVTPYRQQIFRLLLSEKCRAEKTVEEQLNIATRFSKDFDKTLYSKFYLERDFRSPTSLGEGRLPELHKFILDNKNVIITHKLFSMFTNETCELIKSSGYTLIIDEDLPLIKQHIVHIKDYEMLLHHSIIKEVEENGATTIRWVDDEYIGEFNKLMQFCNNGSIVAINESPKCKLLVWRIDKESFECFDDIWLLTYIYNASKVCCFSKINKYDVDIHTLDENMNLVPVEDMVVDIEQGKSFNRLINIYQGNLNDVGLKRTALSATWFKRNKDLRQKVRNNIYNYYANITKVDSINFLWTTFSAHREQVERNGYKGSFLALNARATNAFSHTKVLAYCCNRFENPNIVSYYRLFGVEIDQELMALSEMVQWVWRSQIRDGKPIDIYIPSSRMRNLLIEWLNK